MFVFKIHQTAVIFSCLAFAPSPASAQFDSRPKRIIQPLAFQQVKINAALYFGQPSVGFAPRDFDKGK